MALTQAQIREVGAAMIAADPTLGRTFQRGDLDAAISAADAWIEAATTALDAAMPALWQAKATTTQKMQMRAYVAMKRAGVG